MKLLYLSNSRLPSETASSVHVMKMCQALSKIGFEVDLIGLRNGKKTMSQIFEFYNVYSNFNLSLLPIKLPKINLIILLIMSLIKSLSANIIYSRWRLGTFIISIILSRKTIIYEMHLMPQSSIQGRIETYLIKKKKVSKYIFITQSLKDDYLKKYPELKNRNTMVLPDGADVPRHKEKGNFERNNGRLQISYVGSFYPGKGIEIVIELANSVKDADFHIIGGNEEQVDQYKNLVKNNNVTFYGYQDQATISHLLNKSDIGLLPNQPVVKVGNKEVLDIGTWTSPMKMFDYMAHKNAIISSDLKVLREILTDNYNAKLVKHDVLSQWVMAIEEFKTNRNEILRIAENAFHDLESKYSWQKRAERALKEWM